MQISRLSIVRNRTIRCCGFRSRVVLPVAEPFFLMMHLERCSVSVFHSFTDLRNILIWGQKGKVKSLLRCLFRKPKRPNFSAALFKKRLHPPHAISHCSFLISLKSCFRLKFRNFHSASAEQFRSSWMSQMSLKRTDLFILPKVVKMSVSVPAQPITFNLVWIFSLYNKSIQGMILVWFHIFG